MQDSPKSLKIPAFSQAKITEITNAVRALCVIYNTSLNYETTHQVFRKAVEERMPVFRTALAGIEEIPLFFTAGQIRVGGLPLEPGSGMFQKLSQVFETIGTSSISILHSVTSDDLRNLTRLITLKADDIALHGLQRLLTKEGVRGIIENRVKTQVVSTDSADSRKAATDRESPSRHRRSRQPGTTAAWQIDEPVEAPLFQAMDNSSSRSFGSFVKGAIGAFARNEARIEEVVEIISTAFEHRLNERLEEVRNNSDRKIIRLESIKDLVLKELENHSVAALILDSDLKILAANRLGRELLGMITTIDRESSLGMFVVSQQERQQVEINGAVRVAHLLTSASRASGDSMMLLSLE